jgi:hypothetical protein
MTGETSVVPAEAEMIRNGDGGKNRGYELAAAKRRLEYGTPFAGSACRMGSGYPFCLG